MTAAACVLCPLPTAAGPVPQQHGQSGGRCGGRGSAVGCGDRSTQHAGRRRVCRRDHVLMMIWSTHDRSLTSQCPAPSASPSPCMWVAPCAGQGLCRARSQWACHPRVRAPFARSLRLGARGGHDTGAARVTCMRARCLHLLFSPSTFSGVLHTPTSFLPSRWSFVRYACHSRLESGDPSFPSSPLRVLCLALLSHPLNSRQRAYHLPWAHNALSKAF